MGRTDVEGLMQLAGGVIVGGLAMYRLAGRNEPQPDEKQDPKKQYIDSIAQNQTIKVAHVAHESPTESKHDRPEWASSKQPQAQPNEIPGDWRASTDVSKPSQHDDETSSSASTHSDEPTVEKTSQRERLPSWMSQKDPCLNHSEVLESVSTHLTSSSNISKVSTARESVANVAQKLSDVVFVYPVVNDAYLGQDLSDNVERNVLGHNVQVKKMETRSGAAGAVVGALSAGSSASVLASSKSLRMMLPSMFQIASQRLPAVFHVSAQSIGENLAISSSLEDIAAVRDTGFALLGSSNAQEAHDMAIVAHVSAAKSSTPFVHFFDGVRTLNQVEKISVAPSAVLKYAAESAQASPTSLQGLEAAATESCPHVATIVDDTMKSMEEALGRRYRIFEYYGDADADALVVTMGAPANVLKETVARFGKQGKVGVLVVRLLRPWSSAHFLAAVPKTVRRVCVLDQAANLRPLFQDVAASFHSNAAWVTPLVIGGRIVAGPEADQFTPADAVAVFNNLNADNPRPNFTVCDNSSVNSLRIERNVARAYSAEGTKEIVHYTGNDSCTAEFALASILGAKLGFQVQQSSARDAMLGDEGVSRHDLRFGASKIDAQYSVIAADVVVCDEESLQSNVDVLADAKERATLIITGNNESSKDLNALPKYVRCVLARKGIKLNIVDVSEFEHVEGASDWLAASAALFVAEPEQYTKAVPFIKQAFRQAFSNVEVDVGKEMVAAVDRLETLITMVEPPSLGALELTTPRSVIADNFEAQSWASASTFDRQNGEEINRFTPRAVITTPEANEKDSVPTVAKPHQIAWNLVFRESFGTKSVLRPTEHNVYTVHLTSRKRLTPDDYNRNIFHLEFDITGTGLKYDIGDALGVYGHNDEEQVEEFLNLMGWDGDMFVSMPQRGHMPQRTKELVTLRNLFIQYLDIFGRPSKKFYTGLAQHTDDRYEYLRLMHIGTDDAEAFKLGVHETVTYVDLMRQFSTARPSVQDFVAMVPDIKPRHYSIASSMKMNPGSVHLLVVAVDWKTPLGKVRQGQCTRYLASMKPGSAVTVDIMPSVLRLPPSPKQPIIMAGLGTGMAPFRAFVQERKIQKEQGLEVGPIVLYFGARHRHQEYLYGDEWDEYFNEGLVTRLGLAFSRDQSKKVYIQHKIEEDGEMLKKYLGEMNGSFYLCGPTWPVPDVRDAIAKGLNPEKVVDGVVDIECVEELKEQGRYVLEVY